MRSRASNTGNAEVKPKEPRDAAPEGSAVTRLSVLPSTMMQMAVSPSACSVTPVCMSMLSGVML